MVEAMIDHEKLALYQALLITVNPFEEKAAMDTRYLSKIGALQLLIEDASDAAIHVLAFTALHSPEEAICQRAIEGLAGLSKLGNIHALDDLFKLALESNHDKARQAIEGNKLEHPGLQKQAAFLLIAAQVEELRKVDSNLHNVTEYFFNAPQNSRKFLLQSASRIKLQHWVSLAECIDRPSEAAFDQLVMDFASMTEDERTLSLNYLERLADTGILDAQNATCLIYIYWDSEPARNLALSKQWSPTHPSDRAIFYFLTGSWQNFETLDFDRRLIRAGYEQASPDLKKKILSQSRYSGQVEWLQNTPGISKPRYVSDMQDADWMAAIDALVKRSDFKALWLLSQIAPPWWSVLAITHLENCGWQPKNPEENNFLNTLLELRKRCTRPALACVKPKSCDLLEGDVISAGFSDSGNKVAVGAADNRILYGSLLEGTWQTTIFYPPTPQQRTIVVTRDGEYLAAVNSDQTVRIYLLPEGKLIKILAGHTNLVRSMVLSRDERMLYTAGFDGVVYRWRFPTGGQEQIHKSDTEIYSLAETHHKRILIGDGNGQIHVWDADAKRLTRTLSGHSAAVTSITTAAGDLAASLSIDRTIRIWNFISGKEINRIQIPDYMEQPGEIFLTPDERYVLCAGVRGSFSIWSVSTANMVLTLGSDTDTKPIVSVWANSDLSEIKAVSASGSLYEYQTQTLAWLLRPLEQSKGLTIEKIDLCLANSEPHLGEIPWLKYIHELLKWKQRFDIIVSAPQTLQTGEFDIQISPMQ